MNKNLCMTTIVVAGLLAGCGGNPEPTEPAAVEVPKVFTTTAPEGTPVPIPEARTSVSPGDAIVLAGKIMGVNDPFVEGRGVFVLGDEATITSCDQREDDACETPWDACCDPSEVLMAGTATIQVLGDDGKVLARGLKGVEGLKELTRVQVAGTVAPQATPEALIVNADAIYVVP